MALSNVTSIASYLTTGYWHDAGMIAPVWRVAPGDTMQVQNALPPAEAAVAELALSAWTSVSGIDFRTDASFDDAQITLNADGGNSAGAGFLYRPDGSMIRSDITIGASWSLYYGTALDSYYMQTLVHEIGHALGLGHAGPYNGQASYGRDNVFEDDSWQMSVMSYFAPGENPVARASYAWAITPMPADIVAIHQLYGKPTGINNGATTYGWNSNADGIHGVIGRALQTGTLTDPVMLTIYDQGGVDTINLSHDTHDQRITLAAESFSDVLGQSGNLGIAYETVIENVLAGTGDDTVVGNIAANLLAGGHGNDRLWGAGGADTLNGGVGNDLLSGDAGNDLLIGGTGADRMLGGAGDDLLIGAIGSDWGDGGAGRDTLSGGDGDDTLSGGADADRLNGHEGSDLIAGDQGADTLIGGAGNDTLNGGADNDLMLGGAGRNLLTGGHGNDTLIGAGENDRMFSGIGDDRQVFYAGNDTGYGGAGNDRLNGGNGDDRLSGEDGDDSLYGGIHNDLLLGGAGDDALWGDRHDDRLDGGSGNDRLSGGWENDLLWGRAGADTLLGGQGNDTMEGGTGADLMTGNAGADRFVFRSAVESSVRAFDTITDFQRGLDRLDFTTLDLVWFGTRDFSGSGRSELRYDLDGADLIVLADTTGDGFANLRLCLSGTGAIGAQDFLL